MEWTPAYEENRLAESHPTLPIQFGPYVLVSLLGEGGMARVYRAVLQGPMGFRKELAIKMIRTDRAEDSEALVHSLVNEARLGGQLRHPNVADTYEFGVVEDQFYIALEFVNGMTLRSLLEGARARGVHLPWGAVLDMALQTCDALQYAHAAHDPDGQPLNLVHRDLKPENLILSTAGQVKVMDFGIARSKAALYRTTVSGGTKGTPGYMSPEQLKDPDGLDRRSDLFALGAIVVESLTGEPLVDGNPVESMLWKIVSGDFTERLEAVDRILPEMTPVLARCLQVDREQRVPDAATLASELRAVRDALGEDQGCRELMQLTSAFARGETGTLMAAGDEIVERASRGDRDSGWEAWLEMLLEHPGEGGDPFRGGIHDPVSAGDAEGMISAIEEEGAHPTVVWQAEDTAAWSSPEDAGDGSGAALPSRLRRTGLFALGCLAGIPFIVGLMILVFEDVSRAIRYGGPFMYLVTLMSVISCGYAASRAVTWRTGRAGAALLMVFPLLSATLGSLAVTAGATQALISVKEMATEQPDKVHVLLTWASAIALYPEFMGLVFMAACLLVSAVGIALAQRPLDGGGGPTRTSLALVAIALGGGSVLWAAHPFLSAREGAGGPAPFIVFLVLVGCSLTCASLSDRQEGPTVARARWLAACCTVLAVGAAAKAVDIQQQIHLFKAFRDVEVVDGIEAAQRFSDAVIFAAPWPLVAWTALAVVVATVTIAGRGRPPLRPGKIFTPALLLIALLLTRSSASSHINELVVQVVPAYLNASARWQLGFELEDVTGDSPRAGSVRVSTAPPDSPVQPGDTLLAVNRRTLSSVKGLLVGLRACSCETEDACAIADTCLTPGDTLEFEVARPAGEDGAAGTLETISVTWLGGDVAP